MSETDATDAAPRGSSSTLTLTQPDVRAERSAGDGTTSAGPPQAAPPSAGAAFPLRSDISLEILGRMRWSQELHAAFLEAVAACGGRAGAKPKAVFESMGVAGLTLPQVKSHLQKYRNVSPPSQPPSPKRRRTRGTLPAPAPPLPPPLPPPPEMWPCGGARALEALPPDGPAGGLPTLLEAALILEASNEAAAQHPIPAALPPSPPQQHLPPPVGPVGGCAPPPPPPPPPPGPGRLSLVAQPPLLPSTVLVRPHNLALTGGGSPLGANGLVQRAARSGLPNAVAAAEALNAERLAWMAAGQLLNDSRHTTGQQQDQQEAAAAAGALGGGGGGLAAAATAAAAAAAAAAGPTFASAAQQGAPAQPHAFPREAEQGGCALRVACGLQALLQQQAALTAALRASLRQDLAALLPAQAQTQAQAAALAATASLLPLLPTTPAAAAGAEGGGSAETQRHARYEG